MEWLFYPFLSFFILFTQKIQTKVFNKIFFHWKCSYKLSIIIQKIRKLSKSCPFVPKKSKKIWKNLKKIRKNTIFSFFFLWSQRSFYRNLYYHLSCKNTKKMFKKKVKKKWFSFLQTFFLKSFLDIFLCPISKLKKKFWKLRFFPFFLHF